jgi:hypothetical protein
MTTVALPVSEDFAKIFNRLSQQEQLVLAEYVQKRHNQLLLLATMDRVSQEAERNGLTPEILDEIMRDVS